MESIFWEFVFLPNLVIRLGFGWVMMFNTAFNNFSVLLWQSVLLMDETDVPGENHWPAASHWQTLSHNHDNVVSNTPRHEWDSNSQL
jgi:hypothetical protein